ncbi:hypothetical protein PGT21_012267 [Puccinia graminis f. sp. tritici]|uniref:Uncharacterized protein n=1 Tax=Puccinia graminis f. sp. tritici TaxID=56615 RepID=A0A5B0R8U5_PUCGR|nr:hypothetical protein PGT21_012267 [Puccinia graminis f. sp. tritici]KAA1122030.1 hypothetical protein PGTUg99_021279 [Puccinia graminis f. sp. tritici]
MITRNNTTANNIIPLSDPKAIIKAGNAKKRRSKQLSAQSIAPLRLRLDTTTRIMSDTVPPTRSQEQPANSTHDSTRTTNGTDMSTPKEWFKAVLKVQHSAITQAQEDCQQALEDC